MKYSPRGQDITVDFAEDERRLAVNVISIGPVVEDDELDQLFDEGFRGKHAVPQFGSGLGLYVAKKICEYHNIRLTFRSGAKRFDLNRVPYSEFTATLSIDLA